MAVTPWSGPVNAADPSYSFAFGTTNYRVAPGKTVDIPVYLQETVGSETSVLDANGVGIFGAGVSLRFSSSSSSPATVLTTADILANAAFNSTADRRTAVTSTTATLSEATDFLSFVHADDATPGQSKYLMTIGTFQFTAGMAFGEVTTITTGSNPLGDVNITGNLAALDNAIANVSATITVVPEPSVFALISTGLLGSAACAWRKRKH